MSPKKANGGAKDGGPSRVDPAEPDRDSFLLWWLAALLLMLSATPLWRAAILQPLRPAENSLLCSAQAWNPLLSYIPGLAGFTAVPYWIYAAAAAGLLAMASTRAARGLHPVVVGVFLVGMCFVTSYSQLFAALAVMLAAEVRNRWPTISGNGTGPALRDALPFFGIAVLTAIAAAAVTLEFLIPAVILTTVIFQRALAGTRHDKRLLPWLAMVACWIALLLVPAFLATGYVAAALRPLSAIWLRPPEPLLPSLVPVWQSPEFGLAHVCVLLLIGECWRVQLWKPSATETFFRSPELALFSVIALASTRYFWLASFAIAATATPSARPRVSRRFATRVAQACGALGFVLLLVLVGTHTSTLLTVDFRTRSIDPGDWDAEGPVALTNLDQSSHWQRPPLHDKLPLVVSDRWDVCAAFYPRYLAIIDDWKNWRRQAYIRRDGSWGGFGKWFEEWQPALVAVDSRDLEALRLLTFDSTWKVMGLDPDRALFAASDNPAAVAQQREAAQLLSVLDIPRPSEDVDFQRAIRVGSAAGARRVSLMLTALRRLFASMHLLPEDDARATQRAQIWALFELAHRTQRYSGQPSLLNQSRAMVRWKAMKDQSRIPPAARRRLEHAQAALTAMQPGLVAGAAGDGADAEIESAQAALEEKIREALIAGETRTANRLAESLDEEAPRRFYQAIAEAAWQPPRQTLRDLQAFSATGGLKSALRDECLFYVGLLAIECGDFVIARDSLLAVDEQSPFSHLAAYYLRQLHQR